MAGVSTKAPTIVILGEGSLEAARRVRGALDGAAIYGLAGRTSDTDFSFDEFGETVRRLFREDVPIVAFCAAGIVIRALAPLLQDKHAEPPIIAVAEDGSAVVPLLGGLRGVNDLARRIGQALDTVPAITTTGEVRFGATLEHPPAGYVVRNPGAGKRFMSDLLAGEKVRLSGDAPWLAETRLPFDPAGQLTITVTVRDVEPRERELVFHPRSVVVAVAAGQPDLSTHVVEALRQAGIAPQSVAAVLAAERHADKPEIHAVAAALAKPLRFFGIDGSPAEIARAAIPVPIEQSPADASAAIAVAAAPLDIASTGRARGRLAVIGLGPGTLDWRTPEAVRALAEAQDIVGYETYVRMAGPFRPDQAIHASDNREELERARHALSLAAQGRRVAVVSSGDPGIFAMAAAVMEALDGAESPAWRGVEIVVMPGISAAQAAAARAGAPLGHDFCVLSLSDNLKPWEIIERRLELAASADLVLALYNPISRARPWQLGRAIEILCAHRKPETPVILGRDIGRPDETMRQVTLAELTPEMVDMRTVVLIGSSTTRTIDLTPWVYTPRWYGEPKR
ncbi:MAG: precorrin-3B C(17)-methyltransferase [Alphaproteobacteria bacterium]|nr:precorrin-3B C(17)-methyltransferase [Alphaproteobacteria bacterium]